MKSSPLSTVKERFGDKEKLVSAVKALATDELWLTSRHGDAENQRLNAAKGLARVSNAKLLRLHDTLTLVKKDFGSRAKLIESILSLSSRAKDAGLKSKLERLPTPELVDLQSGASRRSKASDKKAKSPAAAKPKAPKKKKGRSKKAKAKLAAAAKAPAPATAKKK
jgi:hypothetical protein